MNNLIGVYGAAGCGRGILPLLRMQYPETDLVFIDDGRAPGHVNDHDIVDWDAFLRRDAAKRFVCIAIAASSIRQTIAERCEAASVPLIEARAESVVQMDNVSIGPGACLSPYVTIVSNVSIGCNFHANLYSYVEHDCVIGNFVTLAPGAKINGDVKIGDHAYIGSSAVVRQGITIGARAVIGMGAVVTRNVPPEVTVVGNPAKPLVED